MKKYLSILLAVMMLIYALLLAACQGNSTDPTKTPAGGTPTQTVTAAPSTGDPTAAPSTGDATPDPTSTPAPVTTSDPTSTPAQRSLNDIIDKTLALTSYNARFDLSVESRVGEKTASPVWAKYTIGVDGVSALCVRTVASGKDTLTENIFTNESGVFVKENTGNKKAEDYDLRALVASIAAKLPVDAPGFEELEGSASIQLDEAQFKSAFALFLERMDLAAANAGAGVTVKDAKVETTFGEYLNTYRLTFTLETVKDQNTVVSSVDARLTFDNPGADVTVTPPADLSDYTKLP